MYRKKTDTNLYLNWNAYAPRTWKIGILKGMVRRAHIICSDERGFKDEIQHLKRVFVKINGYPSRIVSKTICQIKSSLDVLNNNGNTANIVENNTGNVVETVQTPIENQNDNESKPYICLPYRGDQGVDIINKFRRKVTQILPKSCKPRFTYKGRKLGAAFRIKDKVPQKYISDIVYGYKLDSNGQQIFNPDYVGQTDVPFGTRSYQHGNTDKKSHIYKDSKKENYEVKQEDFRILDRGYTKLLDRRIAEALHVNEHKPILNGQKISYKLKLFT